MCLNEKVDKNTGNNSLFAVLHGDALSAPGRIQIWRSKIPSGGKIKWTLQSECGGIRFFGLMNKKRGEPVMLLRSVVIAASTVFAVSSHAVFSDTASSQAPNPQSQNISCQQDVSFCSDDQICNAAVAQNGRKKEWATASAFQKFVVEAKLRGLECRGESPKRVSKDSGNLNARGINRRSDSQQEVSEAPPVGFDWREYNSKTFISSMVSKYISRPLKLPERDVARVYLDFNGDGISDYFVAALQYNRFFFKIDMDPKTARKSNLRFYAGTSNGEFKLDKNMLSGDGMGCIHPRKAIVNDFNGDERPDIFIACTGWDASPFPGEASQILLSQPDGTFTVREILSPTGYVHSAASADFDGDGVADILVNDSKLKNPYQLWIGKGDGSFKKGKRFKLKGVYSQTYFETEVFDFDGDARFDLFVSGLEGGKNSSKVYFNKAESGFSPGKMINLPTLKGTECLDAVGIIKDGRPSIFLLCTGDRSAEYYRGVFIQRFDLDTSKSTVVYQNKNRSWFPWLVTLDSGDGITFGSDDAWEKPVDGR